MQEPYRVIAHEALVHDVVKVHQEITVGEHILVPGHHLTDQLEGLQFASLVLCRQHGALKRGGVPLSGAGDTSILLSCSRGLRS